MLTVVSTHGQMYHNGDRWAVQCRFANGEEGIVTARRLSVLRKRLKERGVSEQEIARLSKGRQHATYPRPPAAPGEERH